MKRSSALRRTAHTWPMLSMLAGLIFFCMALFGCTCPKPPPLPPAPPPKIVEVSKPCMERLPPLPGVTLPTVDGQALSVTIDAKNFRALAHTLIVLIRHVETQQARCGVIDK